MKPNPPTALDRVSVRRLLMYIQKSLTSIMRNHWLDSEGIKQQVQEEMVRLYEAGAFWDCDHTTVDDDSLIVAIQPKRYADWIYIEARTTCNISE